MPDFLVEPTAARALGTGCMTCGTSGAVPRGYVFLNVNHLPYGDLYVCAACADQIGRAVGGIDPVQAHELHGIVDELSETLERLQVELAAEKVDKVVPLADVVDFFEERAKRRPDEAAPAAAPRKPKATA